MVLAAVTAASAWSAEPTRIGTVKIAAAGGVFIAAEKGYFAAEGIDPTLVYFNAPEPVAVAVVSGDIVFGGTGISAGLYNLAGQGALKLIAAQAHEWPGFRVNAIVVSNRADEAGLKRYADLAGHSLAVAQIGGPTHYAAALLAEKYGVALESIRFLAVQSNPNVVSAVSGGTADAALLPATIVTPGAARGAFKILGWIGDETPWQSSAVFTATHTADTQPGLVQGFLRALRKGQTEYHDAFTAPDGTRHDGPGAAEAVAIIAKYTGQSEAQIRLGIAYVDSDARLDLRDVAHQIAWFQSQNMLKRGIALEAIVDRRYLIPLEER